MTTAQMFGTIFPQIVPALWEHSRILFPRTVGISIEGTDRLTCRKQSRVKFKFLWCEKSLFKLIRIGREGFPFRNPSETYPFVLRVLTHEG